MNRARQASKEKNLKLRLPVMTPIIKASPETFEGIIYHSGRTWRRLLARGMSRRERIAITASR